MTLVELIVLLVVAAIAGIIGQSLGGYKRDSILLAIVLGFVGAFIGAWLARTLGLPIILPVTIGGVSFPIVWAVIGAALLVALMGVTHSRRGYRWGVTPPSRGILVLSVLLAILAFLVSQAIVAVPFSAWSLLAAAYILLLLGNLVSGL
jgi:uncharacterized membrane protein YeaQ/YmgE (transglycosylase-associated protein family)